MHISQKRVACLAGAALVLAGLSVTPVAGASADTALPVKDQVLTVGATSAQRNLTWLSGSGVDDYVEIAQATGGKDFHKSIDVKPFSTGTAGEQAGYDYNQVALDGLKTNTDYVYRIRTTTSVSGTREFSTGSSGNFNFLVYGDPQVYTGTKTNTTPDGQTYTTNPSAGWANTLRVSTDKFPNTAFLVSAGDQIDSKVASQPPEWDEFLAPGQLSRYPLSTTVGNHDNSSGNGYLYAQHFALPNVSATAGVSSPGAGDYSFVHNDVLFLNINTNNDDASGNPSISDHQAFLSDAISRAGNVKWKILTFHQAPFSSADHPNDSDVEYLRAHLTPVISQLGINLVLNGHDHDYTRSYLMNGDQVASSDKDGALSQQPGQVLYIATNSASNGKFYDLSGSEPGNDYYWAAVADQEYVPNYTNVEVKGNALNITTYRNDGSVVDQVSLTQANK